jgi:chlorite dismutase
MEIINSTYKTKEEKVSGTVEKQIADLKTQINTSEARLKDMRSLSSKSSVMIMKSRKKTLQT